jgi:hypothetical protein
MRSTARRSEYDKTDRAANASVAPPAAGTDAAGSPRLAARARHTADDAGPAVSDAHPTHDHAHPTHDHARPTDDHPPSVEDGAPSAPEAPRGEPPFTIADRLAELGPGPELARVLTELHVSSLDDDALMEGVAACERLLAWATARQAEMITAFAAKQPTSRLEFTADAVAARLGTTRRSATLKVDLAASLTACPVVAERLSAGDIDPGKARVIVTEVAEAPAESQHAILMDLLPRAGRLTAPQLRNRIRRAALAADPVAAQRRAAAEEERRAVTLTPTGDAMAYLTFYLPAVAATTALSAIDALAATAATPGDARSPDARRVDAFTDLLRHVLDTGLTLDGTALSRTQRRRPHIHVTIAASTLLGIDEKPAELAGYGPIPADVARAVAVEGDWLTLATDSRGLVVGRGRTTYRPSAGLAASILARDVTCRFPGCRVPAVRCDLDHIEPFDPGRPAADQTRLENVQALCRHHHRLKTHADWQVRRDPRTGQTTWTTPWGRSYVRDPDPPLESPSARTGNSEPGDAEASNATPGQTPPSPTGPRQRPVNGPPPGEPPF